jgi:copper transport protein
MGGNQKKMITGKRLALLRWEPAWCILLFLCLSVIGGCGTISSPTTTIRQFPPAEVAQPFHGTVKTLDGDFTVTLDITPNRSGPNVFTVRVMDDHTDTLASHVNITLYTTMQDMAMGTDSITLRADEKGDYSATSDNLSMSGHWAIGIAIQTPDHALHKAGVSLVTSF